MLSSNSEGLQRVQDLALRDNNLLHHADLEIFRFAFKQLRKGPHQAWIKRHGKNIKEGAVKKIVKNSILN